MNSRDDAAGRAWPRRRDPAGPGYVPWEVTGEQSAKHCPQAGG